MKIPIHFSDQGFFWFFFLKRVLRTYLIFQEGISLGSIFGKIPEASLLCLGHTQLGLHAAVRHRQIPSPKREEKIF